MRYLLLFILSINLMHANEIVTCKDYGKFSKNIIGKSPPTNMMIQTIKSYNFPDKISKKDQVFKKLSSIESLVKKEVDLVILWNSKGDYSNLASKLQKVNIDTCSLPLDSIKDYVDSYLVLGKIMQKEQRVILLSEYMKSKLKLIDTIKQQIPIEKRLSVYYAKGTNGLESECENSVHSEVIELIGAVNPIKCNGIKNLHVNINLEKLLILNPDIIITSSKEFYKNIFEQSKYKYLQAVKNKRVYLIPKKPINWIDNPPSFLKILGTLWLGQKVYPQYYKYNFESEKKKFFELFLQQGAL